MKAMSLIHTIIYYMVHIAILSFRAMFFWPRIWCAVVRRHIPLVFFNLEKFFSICFASHNWLFFLKSLDAWPFSPGYIQFTHLGQGCHEWWCVLLSAWIRRHRMSVGPIGDAEFDRWLMSFPRPHKKSKGYIFPFESKKCFVGRCFETVLSPNKLLLNCFSIHWWFFPESIITMTIAKWDCPLLNN